MSASREYRNPNTGTRWTFPRDARRYLATVDLVSRNTGGGGPCCDNGHFDCAPWEGGPCSAGVYAEYLFPPPVRRRAYFYIENDAHRAFGDDAIRPRVGFVDLHTIEEAT